MDENDNSQSRFPRSSLRARSRTVMATPADIADYTPRSTDVERPTTSIEDALDISLGDMSEVGASTASALSDALGDDFSVDQPEQGANTESFAAPELESARASVLDAIGEVSALAEVEQFVQDPEPESVAPIAKILRPASAQSEVSAESVLEVAPVAQRVLERVVLSPDESVETSGRERIFWKKPGRIVGFLVSYASDPLGQHVVLREGRLLISCENGSSDNCLVISHESVSPMHAIMRVAADGSILILDQLSEHGTRIRRAESGNEESLLGDKSYLRHGDVVIFGECEYHLCVLGAAAIVGAKDSKGDKVTS
ncbi:MAG: FHA domain-containing protein [Pseudomonadota bacterium]